MKLKIENRLDLVFRYDIFNELPNSSLTNVLKFGSTSKYLLRYNNILKIYVR